MPQKITESGLEKHLGEKVILHKEKRGIVGKLSVKYNHVCVKEEILFVSPLNKVSTVISLTRSEGLTDLEQKINKVQGNMIYGWFYRNYFLKNGEILGIETALPSGKKTFRRYEIYVKHGL